ncbi:hypothetical protein [Amycolatopsis sp. NPDC059021]|uniref:hypothetical protein n=1 Tax=Amycolatopsis sp. NPDC059021 TaxID=3346704 RepID=UPI00366FEEF8
MNERLLAALNDLAGLAGVPATALGDGHARWTIYHACLDLPGAAGALRECAALEPDHAVASALVVAMLERVPRAERAQWVALLAPAVREYADGRRSELEVLDDIRDGALPAKVAREHLGEWSDWLQRRIGGTAADPEILRLLAERGRTKRIRHLARESLSALGG